MSIDWVTHGDGCVNLAHGCMKYHNDDLIPQYLAMAVYFYSVAGCDTTTCSYCSGEGYLQAGRIHGMRRLTLCEECLGVGVVAEIRSV